MKIIITSGGFDPLHPGHVRMFRHAKEQCDYHVVGVNSDKWLVRKKGQYFMPWEYRAELVQSVRWVDEVLSFNDNDNTACDLLHLVREKYPDAKLFFANGGDRTKNNVPEQQTAETLGIELLWGIGGDNKLAASSVLLEQYARKLNKKDTQFNPLRLIARKY